MLFSSTVFLFCFLPIVSFLYLCARPSIRQYVLAFASLFFYAWGEPDYVAVMLFVCLVSYLTALRIKHQNITHESVKNKVYLGMALCVDLGILFYFKYYNFFIENINKISCHPFLSHNNFFSPSYNKISSLVKFAFFHCNSFIVSFSI